MDSGGVSHQRSGWVPGWALESQTAERDTNSAKLLRRLVENFKNADRMPCVCYDFLDARQSRDSEA